MSREQDSVAAEVEQIARAMYYFGDWDTYAVEAQKNYWRGKARLAIAALAALSHPQAASSTQAGDLERAVVAFGELQYECGKAYALVGCGKAEDSAFTNAAVRCDRAQAELVATIRRLASSTTPASGGAGMLPDTLMAVSDEWYSLCERAPHAFKIGISGELAQAIVETVCLTAAQEGAQGERGAECQHNWIADPDVPGALYCHRCNCTRRGSP